MGIPLARLRVFVWVSLAGCAACATSGQVPDRSTVDSAIRTRTNAGIRVNGTEPLPPNVAVNDGLTSEEAVAIALWNSPSFQATLADLGIARADVVEAGLLRNPVLSLLFPVGQKQLEWTRQFRTAHADAVIADRRLQLTTEIAELAQRLTSITEARLKAGDISELEARAARSDAARVQVVRRAIEHDRDLARVTCLTDSFSRAYT